MSIKYKVILSFCIITISYCTNKKVSADEKVESNTIVIQSGGGGHDDHEDEHEIIYTTIPIPIPLQLRKSVVNPSYLYPIHQDPSLPSYRLTQRSIIHVPSPAPQLQPTPDYFINRFRTIPPNDHLPPSPDLPNYRQPLPSPNERQSNSYDLPSQQQLPPIHPSTMRSPPPAPPSLTEPAPSLPMDTRSPSAVVTPSFTPPLHPLPNVAQENDDRDNRYYSLHEPWPPAYSNPDKNIKPSSTEVQDDNNKDGNRQNNDNNNSNNNNNNMADSDDGQDEGRGEADYPPGDQDYVANHEGQDYNGDYREGYQPVEPVKNVIDGALEVNGPVFGEFYHPQYPNAHDYPDFQVKPAVDDQLIDQTNYNLPSGSQEIINFQDPGIAIDYQNVVYPMDPDYTINGQADHQSNQDKQSTYSENQDRPSQPPPKQPVTPQIDYSQGYRDDYYSSENDERVRNEQASNNEQAENVNENINSDNNGNNNNNNINNEDEEEEENQNNQVDRNYIPLRPETFDNRESTTSGRLIDYSESNYNNGYNDESSTNPIDLKTMVTFPLNSGTELGVRPDLDHSGPMTEFDLTGDPYLDNQVQKQAANSMENHLNSLDHGQFGRRNEPLLNDNQMKPEPSSVTMNDYLAPGDQQDGESIQPGQYAETNNWRGENGDYNDRSNQFNLPSTPSILSNRLKQSTGDLAFNNQGERFDQEDWGNY